MTDVFAALADPTRRHIAERIAGAGPITATTLAADLPITRQAVAKHLGVLGDAGLVSSARVGRETRYDFQPAALDELTHWAAEVGAAWDRRLRDLRALVEGRTP
ncbi:MAG: helix-turn-helix transcriptional regulator [Actinomycetia bacterium]|nr:helix-turn-helix transcriptional regulator [Actinomycetes bacterium]